MFDEYCALDPGNYRAPNQGRNRCKLHEKPGSRYPNSFIGRRSGCRCLSDNLNTKDEAAVKGAIIRLLLL